MNWNIPTALLMAAFLAGCNSAEYDTDQQYVLSEDEQKDYLSYVKQPQQFGFTVYEKQGGGIALKGVAHLHPLHAASANFIGGGGPRSVAGGEGPGGVKAKLPVTRAAPPPRA